MLATNDRNNEIRRRWTNRLLALVATALMACTPPAEEADEGEPGEGEGTGRPATLVESVRLDTTEFVEQIELNGITEAIRSAEIRAQVGGRITHFELVEGQRVERGETVLRINSASGRATIDRLEVDLSQVESDIDRMQRLIQRGLGTSAELERLESQRDSLRQGIDEVEVGIRETRHRAPISGEVTDTFKEEGEFMGQGDPAARIVDISTIVVDVGLPEREISHVAEGQEVQIRLPAINRQVTGVIHRIGLEANPRNRTFPLEIHVENADESLRAGMRATAIVTKGVFEDAVVVPRDAIIQTVDGSEVFLNVDGVATPRAIVTGPGLGRFVIAEGLAGGDELIVRGQRALVQGEPIEITRSGECCHDQFQHYRFGENAPVLPDEPAATDGAGEGTGR